MKSVPLLLAIATVASLSVSPFAIAKDTAPEPSMAAKVENWTEAQWTAAQKEWAKDEAKWAGCRKQADVKNLSGRKSWSFLYECMKS